MGPTPLWPLQHADQNASLPTPLGATTPIPVTTTLRMIVLPPKPNAPGEACGRGTERPDGRRKRPWRVLRNRQRVSFVLARVALRWAWARWELRSVRECQSPAPNYPNYLGNSKVTSCQS